MVGVVGERGAFGSEKWLNKMRFFVVVYVIDGWFVDSF